MWRLCGMVIPWMQRRGCALFEEDLKSGTARDIERHFDHGDDANMQTADGRQTLLHAAVRARSRVGVESLIRHGVRIDERDADGVCAIRRAIDDPHPDFRIIKALVECDARLMMSTIDSDTSAAIIYAAATYGRPDIVEIIVADCGGDINAKTQSGDALLHMCVREMEMVGIETLLTYGADTEQRNAYGDTPLILATGMQCGRIIQMLLRSGASPDAVNPAGAGSASLDIALQNRDVITAKLLLDGGANPNRVDANGESPLHRAAALDLPQHAALLLDAGANPRIANRLGFTPLCTAHKSGAVRTAAVLAARGAPLIGSDL